MIWIWESNCDFGLESILKIFCYTRYPLSTVDLEKFKKWKNYRFDPFSDQL